MLIKKLASIKSSFLCDIRNERKEEVEDGQESKKERKTKNYN